MCLPKLNLDANLLVHESHSILIFLAGWAWSSLDPASCCFSKCLDMLNEDVNFFRHWGQTCFDGEGAFAKWASFSWTWKDTFDKNLSSHTLQLNGYWLFLILFSLGGGVNTTSSSSELGIYFYKSSKFSVFSCCLLNSHPDPPTPLWFFNRFCPWVQFCTQLTLQEPSYELNPCVLQPLS